MINKLSFLILCTLLISILEVPAQQAYTQEKDNAVSSFTAGGHTVYHLEPGTINGKQVVFSAAYDGTVLCHSPEGELIWKTSTGEGFLFDIEAADIDRDGDDEALVASSDGALHAIDHNGTLLWRFQREAPLWRVHALETEKGIIILTGGVERTVHALDASGNELARKSLDGIIRHLSTGDFKGDGKQYVAVVSTTQRFSFKLHLLDLDELSSIWEQPMIRNGYFSMEVFDFNQDGKDNMVFGLNASYPHQLIVYNGSGECKVVTGGETHQGFNWQAIHPAYEWKKDAGIAQLPYTMNLIAYAPGREGTEDRIFNIYEKHLIVKDRQGNVRSDLSSSIVFSNIAYDTQSGKLYLGSEISGGDGIYVINPHLEGWEKEFESLKPVGKITQLEENMNTLLQQAENFQLPEYQSKPEKTAITLQQNPEEIKER